MDKSIMRVRQTIMRRVLLVVLAFLLFIPIVAIGTTTTTVSANTTTKPEITVESKTVHRGQTFDLEVSLDGNTGISALLVDLEYDESAMTLIEVTRGSKDPNKKEALAAHNFSVTGDVVEEDAFRLLWDGAKNDTTGVLATLSFQSNYKAPIGKYDVKIIVDEVNTISEYGNPIAIDVTNGVVELIYGESKVIYKNYDGTVLYEKDYTDNKDGVFPEYEGNTPTRPKDEMYEYEFVGWQGAVPNVKNEIWYIAQYKETAIQYNVIFYVEGLGTGDSYFNAASVGYGNSVDLSYVPKQTNRVFSGWYFDEDYTQKVGTSLLMPANDINLYGYMKYNVREDELPQITLSVDKIENDVAFVNVDVTKNPSLAGLVLTLDYDKEALEFIAFEEGEAFEPKDFHTTGTEDGLNVDEFKFYWEDDVNSYATGRILTLQFKIKESAQAGLYYVTMKYDETSDATYYNAEEKDLWYTKLEIIGTNVPKGVIYHWYEETEDGSGIDVTTEEGQSPETVLEVKKITRKTTVPHESVIAAAGENMELKDVYSVRLLRDGIEVKPNGKITVKIALTEAQKKCTTIMVFHLDSDGKLTFYESKRENDFVVFETEHLSNWAIIGNVVAGVGGTTQAPTNTPILIIAPTMLAIATMGLTLVLIARAKKKKQVFVYTKDE